MRTLAFVLLGSFALVITGCGGGSSPMPPQGHSFLGNAKRKSAPAAYHVIDLGAGFTPGRINKSGLVVGTLTRFVNGENTYMAAMYAGGHLTTLGTLPGATGSFARDVNDSGEIVGDSDTNSGLLPTAVRFHPGSIPTALLSAGDSPQGSSAAAVNDSGTIVGYAYSSASATCADAVVFDGSGGVASDLGLGGAFAIDATGAIAVGQTLGYSCTRDVGQTDSPVVYDPAPLALPTPPGTHFSAQGSYWPPSDMNDKGDIVGQTSTANGFYFYRNGATRLIPTPTGDCSNPIPNAINNDGVIVGVRCIPSGPPPGSAFVKEGNDLVNLNDLINHARRWELESANDINDAGVIVGYGTLKGVGHGFMLVPRGCPLLRQLQR